MKDSVGKARFKREAELKTLANDPRKKKILDYFVRTVGNL